MWFYNKVCHSAAHLAKPPDLQYRFALLRSPRVWAVDFLTHFRPCLTLSVHATLSTHLNVSLNRFNSVPRLFSTYRVLGASDSTANFVYWQSAWNKLIYLLNHFLSIVTCTPSTHFSLFSIDEQTRSFVHLARFESLWWCKIVCVKDSSLTRKNTNVSCKVVADADRSFSADVFVSRLHSDEKELCIIILVRS